MTDSAHHLQHVREQSPLVHCITNDVAMNVAANAVLAVGASPAMVHTPNELADAVLFFASPWGRAVTGQNLVVDGGLVFT